MEQVAAPQQLAPKDKSYFPVRFPSHALFLDGDVQFPCLGPQAAAGTVERPWRLGVGLRNT